MTRRWPVMLVAIAALGLAVGFAILDHYHVGVFHDDAMYLVLARSLATGQGFRYINLPGAPVASHFPPGYPAMLAAIWRMAPDFPANIAAFKAFNACCLAASGVAIAQLARERLHSERWALAAGLIAVVSVPLLVLVTMVLSEPLFLVFLLATLLLAERIVENRVAPKVIVGVGLLAAAATLVRSHGIVLLPAIALPLLVQRRWRDAATFACGALAVIIPWQLWSAAHSAPMPAPLAGNYGSYASWWIRGYRETGPSMIPQTLQRTTSEASAMLASLFAPVPGATPHAISLVALAVTFGIGIVALRRRAPVTLLFIAGYAALVLIWPFPPSRFVWGVWPLLLLVLLAGAQRICADGASSFATLPRVVAALALLWTTVGYSAYELRAVRGRWWASISRAADARIAPAIAWTLANTSPSDVVASDDEGAIYLYTSRRAVPVASFTTSHYLGDRSATVEATEGLMPLMAIYPLRAVLVGTQRTFDAAQYLATRPVPLLALHDQFVGGAAFTVLTR